MTKLTKTEFEALLNIFDYLNENERSDYKNYEDNGVVQDNHIYVSVRVLGELLGLDMTVN